MAEEANTIMTKEATPKTAMFMNRPYSQEERVKKDEEELAQLVKEQKDEGKITEEKTSSEKEPTNAEERTFKKRYGDLRRHTQDKEKQFQTQLDELKSQLDKATRKEIKLPKSDEDIEAWAADYPDVAKIVESIAIKKAKEQSADLESRIQKIDEMSADALKDKAEAELMRHHPDFDDIRDSDEFHDWADEQPKWIQDALYENNNDARAASRAIDLYKSDKGIGKETTTKSDKSAATEVSKKNTRTKVDATEAGKKIRESAVQKMSAQQYEKQADTIMEAIRSGNFIYDVSGSARQVQKMTAHSKMYVPKKNEEYISPFGPSMAYKKLTPTFVKTMNTLMTDELPDFSDQLVGKVKQELEFNKEIEALWMKEVSSFIARFHSYSEQRNSFGVKNLNTEKYNYGIKVNSGWFVRQYEHEYNPIHLHIGSSMSCVGYLALPEGIEKEWEEDYKDHHPANGHIQFVHGTSSGYNNTNFMVKPQVGDFYIFPSDLFHCVYPFKTKGERRSFSVNFNFLEMVKDKDKKNVDKQLFLSITICN